MARKVTLAAIGLLLAACGGTTTAPTATTAPANTPTPETEPAAPTPDFDALEATSEAISAPVRIALERLADIQSVTLISSMLFEDGAAVTVNAEIAPADDNEFTMGRIYDLVAEAVGTVQSIRVVTSVNSAPQRNWLWENGAWTSAVIGS